MANVIDWGLAPADATYITQTPSGSLSAEQALSALGTGLVKNTTGTGVLSIAVAADVPDLSATYLTPAGAQAVSNKTGNISQWTNDSGYLTSVTNITGNAGTATALQTARAINGVNFDG